MMTSDQRHRLAVTSVLGVAVVAALGTVARSVYQADDLYTGLVAASPRFVVLVTIGIGGALVLRGMPRREGTVIHCAQCGYPREDEKKIIASCPECSAPWRWYGNWKRGKPVHHPQSFWAGAVLLSLVLAWGWLRLIAPGLFNSALPTELLISQISATPSWQMEQQWDALLDRPLTAKQELELAELLLDKRVRFGGLSFGGENWMREYIERPTCPEELIDRYFMEVLEVQVLGPSRASAGEFVDFQLIAKYRGSQLQLSGQPLTVYIAGFITDESDERYASSAYALSADDFVARARRQITPIRFDTPGEHMLEFTYWVANQQTPRDSITWQNARTPLIPLPVGYKRRMTVTHTITIEK